MDATEMIRGWKATLDALPKLPMVQIVESIHATIPREDETWINISVATRARPGLKKRITQQLDRYRKPGAYRVGDTIYAHPAVVSELRRALPEAMRSGRVGPSIFSYARHPEPLVVGEAPDRWEMGLNQYRQSIWSGGCES